MTKEFQHPETKEGEIFLANLCDEDYHYICWNTKRQGNQAYCKEGKPISSTKVRPVFVQKSELKEVSEITMIAIKNMNMK